MSLPVGTESAKEFAREVARESAGSDVGGADRQGRALYIHWPFCLSKCPYCDFNSHVRDRIDQGRWRDALLAELDRAAEHAAPGALDSIFFGGGTPSLMAPETAGALIERARSLFGADETLEVTLEANPTSVETGRLAAYRDAGVNRVSLGVQSLREDALRFLGREHDVAAALAAVGAAARLFPRFSFDLIYARPGQSPSSWRDELAEAIGHAGGHISLYQLTIEPGTAFHTAHRLGAFKMPEEEEAARIFDLTRGMLTDAGMPAYEVSNHAAPGHESRHNLTYWRYGEWIGIGPGAHGRVVRSGIKHAEHRIRLPEKWLEAVESRGTGVAEALPLSGRDRLEECLMMGLRLEEGIPLARLEREFGAPLGEGIDQGRLNAAIEEDLLIVDGGHLHATPDGMVRLNALIEHLLR